MKRKPLVMIIGKFSDEDRLKVLKNIKMAKSLAVELWKRDYLVFCPHANSDMEELLGMEDQLPFVDITLRLIDTALDAIIVLPNWRTSEGTIKEIKHAFKKKVPFFFSIEELEAWRTIHYEKKK